MNNYTEILNAKFDADKKTFIEEQDFSKVYVLEVAKEWIPKNAHSSEELSKAVTALGAILGSDEFQKTIAISKEMRASKVIDPQKCQEMASLMTALSESELYLKNTDTAAFKILDKFKDPKTYRTDAFKDFSNSITRFYKYFCEIDRYVRENAISE